MSDIELFHTGFNRPAVFSIERVFGKQKKACLIRKQGTGK
jgi:hypothetical protein